MTHQDQEWRDRLAYWAHRIVEAKTDFRKRAALGGLIMTYDGSNHWRLAALLAELLPPTDWRPDDDGDCE